MSALSTALQEGESKATLATHVVTLRSAINRIKERITSGMHAEMIDEMSAEGIIEIADEALETAI